MSGHAAVGLLGAGLALPLAGAAVLQRWGSARRADDWSRTAPERHAGLDAWARAHGWTATAATDVADELALLVGLAGRVGDEVLAVEPLTVRPGAGRGPELLGTALGCDTPSGRFLAVDAYCEVVPTYRERSRDRAGVGSQVVYASLAGHVSRDPFTLDRLRRGARSTEGRPPLDVAVLAATLDGLPSPCRLRLIGNRLLIATSAHLEPELAVNLLARLRTLAARLGPETIHRRSGISS